MDIYLYNTLTKEKDILNVRLSKGELSVEVKEIIS